jgi:hypothetical protein
MSLAWYMEQVRLCFREMAAPLHLVVAAAAVMGLYASGYC